MSRAKVSYLTSVLSEAPDGMGYYYGLASGDPRQINVRFEGSDGWVTYVGGVQVACRSESKSAAEIAALEFIQCNPVERTE